MYLFDDESRFIPLPVTVNPVAVGAPQSLPVISAAEESSWRIPSLPDAQPLVVSNTYQGLLPPV